MRRWSRLAQPASVSRTADEADRNPAPAPGRRSARTNRSRAAGSAASQEMSVSRPIDASTLALALEDCEIWRRCGWNAMPVALRPSQLVLPHRRRATRFPA